MKKIAALGPEGTYCDIACKRYLRDNNLDYEICYYPNIMKTAYAIDDNTIAILPFENTLDGFVVESMDYIILNKLNICQQIKLSIDFAFVTNAKSINNVKKCYAQFKTYGQCLDFIANYDFDIIRTQSNVESVLMLLNSNEEYGAIIPMHLLETYKFNMIKEHIADSKNNETRFFVVQKDKLNEIYNNELEASISIKALEDRPGILFDILKKFHDLNINLKSIMSRPMKTEMGKYRFYIECSLTKELLYKLNDLCLSFEDDKEISIDILGVYNKL